MKDPKRLFESGSPLERSILGFGRDEAPSGDLARKTLAAMAAVPAAHTAPSPAPTRWTRPRWLVAGACALGLGTAALVGVRHEESAAPAPAPAAPAVLPLENVQPAVVEDAPKKEIAVVTPDSLPSVPARSAAPPASPTSVQRANAPVEPAPASSASIAREVELLDIVKAKLGAGDVSASARALDVYDGEFPRGTLRPEATVLRIRTVLLAGDRAAAEKLGNEFLSGHPSGVHAKRVRALLADPAPAPAK